MRALLIRLLALSAAIAPCVAPAQEFETIGNKTVISEVPGSVTVCRYISPNGSIFERIVTPGIPGRMAGAEYKIGATQSFTTIRVSSRMQVLQRKVTSSAFTTDVDGLETAGRIGIPHFGHVTSRQAMERLFIFLPRLRSSPFVPLNSEVFEQRSVVSRCKYVTTTYSGYRVVVRFGRRLQSHDFVHGSTLGAVKFRNRCLCHVQNLRCRNTVVKAALASSTQHCRLRQIPNVLWV